MDKMISAGETTWTTTPRELWKIPTICQYCIIFLFLLRKTETKFLLWFFTVPTFKLTGGNEAQRNCCPVQRLVVGQVTFKYIESKTGNTLYRTLKGEDFLHLIMQHVLPKGFRRVRDYGFLHSNAKKLLHLVQLILHAVITGIEQRLRPVFKCPCCKSPMVILGFRRIAWGSG